jgi:poly(A) polymerase
MCQISDKILSTNFNFDSEILDLIDERERKFINGCRMAAYLEKNIRNIDVFRLTLKAIKMWARNRGVYLQMFSYLGGIGYTVLLAKIIELYPNYSPLKLLSRFFYIYSKWVWETPVLL